jgi:predicted PurR-regulated permease PerM
MRPQIDRQSLGRLLLTGAAFVVVVAGMRAASELLVPLLLAAFIAIISAPPLFWLKRKGVPNPIAIFIVIAVAIFLGLGVGALVGSSFDDFVNNLPHYQERIRELFGGVPEWFGEIGIDVGGRGAMEAFDPGAAMKLASGILTGLSGALTNGFLIAITVIFILLEASSFPIKLSSCLKDPETSLPYFERFTRDVQRYMAIKTWMSLLTGCVIALWLFVIGVDYPLLWGLLAFLLNYVPNIGSIIAAVPAVLLALVQLGTGSALLTGLGYLVVNMSVGNLLEPRVMGRGLGLSTLVVFLSLVFWGWVFGPVGMLLSVPLTMTIKIALDSSEETQWISVLLGSETEPAAISPAVISKKKGGEAEGDNG